MNLRDLPLFAPKNGRPSKEVAHDDARELTDWLRGKGPTSCHEICKALDWYTRTGRDAERRVRAAAEASDGRIISAPGRPYVHHMDITVADFNKLYDNPYKSQIKHMAERRLSMHRRIHGGCAA